MQRKRLALAALVLAGWPLASCAEAASDAYVVENDPGSVEHVEGSEIGRVLLADGADRRLGVETASVRRTGAQLVVPDSALFVDPEGVWWVYTNPDDGVYVRRAVDVAAQQDGRAILTSGPRPGTRVVTVGVAELYGIESEIGY